METEPSFRAEDKRRMSKGDAHDLANIMKVQAGVEGNGKIDGREPINEDYDEALKTIGELEELIDREPDTLQTSLIMKKMSSLGPVVFGVGLTDLANVFFAFSKECRGKTLTKYLDDLKLEIRRAKEKLKLLKNKVIFMVKMKLSKLLLLLPKF